MCARGVLWWGCAYGFNWMMGKIVGVLSDDAWGLLWVLSGMATLVAAGGLVVSIGLMMHRRR